VGIFCLKFFHLSLVPAALLLSSCSLPPIKAKNPKTQDLLSQEVSLKSDQQAIEKLRSKVPPQRRQENDELKIILDLMVEGNLPPSEVRQRYDRLMRKRRRNHRRAVNRERKAFSKSERESKDQFLEEHKKRREKFKSKKASKEASKEFYAELDRERRDYFSQQREKRRDFETEMRQRTRDFESNLRMWKKTFNQEYRIYSRNYKKR
jgi:hypothetical protein